MQLETPMNTLVSEKDYPIQKKWLLKYLWGYVIFLSIFLGSAFINETNTVANVFFASAIIFVSTFILILQRRAYHYSLDEKFMVLKQGVVSRQERNLPYGVIQNILVKQDFLDRILGLASLVIENAAQGGGYGSFATANRRTGFLSKGNKAEAFGFSGNTVGIPGLSKAHAEELKGIILQKMKENPLDDNQSGL